MQYFSKQTFILGAFAKLGKATFSFFVFVLLSVCLSVCLCASTRLPPEWYAWNLIQTTFIEICRENLNFFELGQKYQTHFIADSDKSRQTKSVSKSQKAVDACLHMAKFWMTEFSSSHSRPRSFICNGGTGHCSTKQSARGTYH